MKKNISVLILFSLLFISGKINAQSKIGFETTSHDFGIIKEENGKVSYEFKFTNKADSPISIENVHASCGCTTPSWTRAAVEPGKSGYVKAVYDPTNRPNSFSKTLSVSYSIGGSTSVEILNIKGFVTPKPKTASDIFPSKNGNLRFTADYFDIGNLKSNETVTKEFKIYNDGSKKINFTLPSKIPAHLKINITPLSLNSKDTGYIKITYDAKAKKDIGNYVYDMVEVETNDSINPVKKIIIIADISVYFPPMNHQDSLKMPKLSFDRSTHNFGTINQGDTVSTNFVMTNSGKTDLIIYKTKASCGCTTSEPEKMLLKPGENTNLKVTFNSAGKSGQHAKSVTVYSNDPTYSEAMVVIKTDVQIPVPKDSTLKK
jgi:hypothetical protein